MQSLHDRGERCSHRGTERRPSFVGAARAHGFEGRTAETQARRDGSGPPPASVASRPRTHRPSKANARPRCIQCEESALATETNSNGYATLARYLAPEVDGLASPESSSRHATIVFSSALRPPPSSSRSTVRASTGSTSAPYRSLDDATCSRTRSPAEHNLRRSVPNGSRM
jgi:hypothetical protein